MFRSFDPYAEEEPLFGFGAPSPHAPSGQQLIGVKTQLGWARPRWTASGSMWLEGEDFSLPLSRFAPGTLEPVFETRPDRGAAPSIQPAWSPTPTPGPGRRAPIRPLQDQRLFDAVDTHLGRATPHWGEDASLSLEIDGVRRPLHHFGAEQLKPAYDVDSGDNGLHASSGSNMLLGANHTDTVLGGEQSDTLLGGDQDETLPTGNRMDWLVGPSSPAPPAKGRAAAGGASRAPAPSGERSGRRPFHPIHNFQDAARGRSSRIFTGYPEPKSGQPGAPPTEAPSLGDRVLQGAEQVVRRSAQASAEAAAKVSINGALIDPRTTPTSKAILKQFLSDDKKRSLVFEEGSEASNELMTSAYVRKQITGAIEKMRRTGQLRDGGRSRYVGKDFLPLDWGGGLTNGIQVGDVVGTMHGGWNVEVKGGMLHFTGTNKTTMESFTGQNLFPHDLVKSPASGALSPVEQTFKFSVPIPPEYLQPSSPSGQGGR